MKEKTGKKRLAAIAGMLLIIIGIVCAVYMQTGNKEKRVEKDLVLASKYLDELEYEQALAVYQGILEIVPNHPDAYLGIVEVYIRQGEFDTALEYAEKGYEITGDERLKEKADMIRSGNIYDSRGLPMKMSHYYANGTLRWWHQYTYNKDGKKASVTHCNADGMVLGSIELKYDQDGNALVDYASDIDTGELSKIECTYQNGLLMEAARYTLSGQQESVIRCEYKDGVLEKRIYIEADGHERYELFEYNAQGQMSRSNAYSIDEGQETWYGYWEYTYDAAGNVTEECWYRYDEETKEWVLKEREVYEYDDADKLIAAKRYGSSGNLMGVERYE